MKFKTSLSKKIISTIVAGAVIIASCPIMSVSATSSDKPKKEDEPGYNPVFSYPEEEFAFTEDLAKIKDIGKLPSYEEFAEQTGYVNKDLSLTELIEKIGTGSDFDLAKFDITGWNIVLTNANELDLFSSLVNNKVENETSAEQQFYANCTIGLSCDIDYASAKSRYKYQPIGTVEYPFNGNFNGNQFEIQNIGITESSDSDYSTGAFGLFGVLGENAVIENFGINTMNIDLPYSVGANVSWVAGVNNGIIQDVYVNGKTSAKIKVSNSTVGGIAAENNGTIKGCYANGYAEASNTEESYSEPQPITSSNNGTVTDCYYIHWENRSYWWYTQANDNGTDNNIHGWKTSCNYEGYNGTCVTIDQIVNMDGVTGTKFRKWLPNMVRYSDYNSKLVQSPFALPCLGTPDIEDGKYIIRTPAQFMFLLRSATRQYYDGNKSYTVSAKLANTIDLKRITLTHHYNAYFTLDGLMTDYDDVCGYIDIGVPKCYGILNLSFDKYVLAYSWTGNITLNNIYFIGGKLRFTAGNRVYGDVYLYLYGNTLNNVHTSIDETFINDNDGYRVSLANNATNCSHSGSISMINYNNCVFGIAGGTYGGGNANHCVLNATIKINGKGCLYGIGNSVKNSISHAVVGSDYGGSISFYGMGYDVDNSLFDGTVNATNFDTTYVIGDTVNYSEAKGKVICNRTTNPYSSVRCEISHGGSHVVFSGEAFGSFTGVCSGDYVLFRGTINAYGDSLVIAVGDGPDYGYNIGSIKVNITANNQNGTIYGLGWNVVKNSKMNGTIEVLNPNNYTSTDGLNIYYCGKALQSCTNYSDVYAPDNYPCKLYVMGGNFYQCNSNCVNYGNIYLNGNAICTSVMQNTLSGINYGDVHMDNTVGIYDRNYEIYVFSFDWSIYDQTIAYSTFKNYGNITVDGYADRDYTKGGSLTVCCIAGSTTRIKDGKTVNYGDITVKGRYIEDLSDRTNRGNLNIYGNIMGKNYGDITLKDVKYPYNVSIKAAWSYNRGNISVNNTDVNSINICPLYAGSYSSIDFSGEELKNDGNVVLNNITNASIYYSGIETTDRNDTDNTKYLINNGDISISDGKNIGNVTVYGAGTGFNGHSGINYLCNYGNISISDTTFKSGAGVAVSGVGGMYLKGTDKGINYGNIEINNCDIPKGALILSGVCSACWWDVGRCYLVNNGDITVKDCNLYYTNINGLIVGDRSVYLTHGVARGDINVINNNFTGSALVIAGAAVSTGNGYTVATNNVYSIGDILVDGNNANTIISGVTGLTNNGTNNTYASLHTGNITVKNHTGNLNVSGIAYKGNVLKNSINTGDINIEQTNSASTVKASGISTYAKNIYSAVNWGDINLNGDILDNSNTNITALGSANDIRMAVNYGNVAVPDTLSKATISAFDSDKTAGYIINYGTFNNAKSRELTDSSNINYIVDLSGNKDTIITSDFAFSNDSAMQPLYTPNDFGAYAFNEATGGYEEKYDAVKTISTKIANYGDDFIKSLSFSFEKTPIFYKWVMNQNFVKNIIDFC